MMPISLTLSAFGPYPDTIEEENIPYLMLETDYSRSDQGQIATRLEALLETLHG